MFEVQIDRSEPVPLHDQVASEYVVPSLMARLAPVIVSRSQDMASVLGVNKNTVLRAAPTQRRRGVGVRRGRGIAVNGRSRTCHCHPEGAGTMDFARSPGFRRTSVITIIEGPATMSILAPPEPSAEEMPDTQPLFEEARQRRRRRRMWLDCHRCHRPHCGLV